MTPEQITAELEPVGIQAVLADKKIKLLAKVNHRDNFALFYARTAYGAMIDVVIKVIEGKRNKRYDAYCDWFNTVCKTKHGYGHCEFDTFARTVAGKAYDQFKAKKI